MATEEHNGSTSGRINKKANDKKYYCHLTGFLEGLAASGYLEVGEIEPLVAECAEFIQRVGDEDANDILQDFECDLLDFETISNCAQVRATVIDPDCEKSNLNRFLGYCRGLVCDGKITIEEAKALHDRINLSSELHEVIGVKQIRISCADAIQDGIISPDESQEICDAIGEVVGDSYGDTGLSAAFGVANYSEYKITDISAEIVESEIVLTGTFRVSPRSILENKLAEYGAIVSRTVTKRTQYLIIGGEASRDWLEMNRGTKLRAAQKLRLTEEFPRFVSESRILRLLGTL